VAGRRPIRGPAHARDDARENVPDLASPPAAWEYGSGRDAMSGPRDFPPAFREFTGPARISS
jgi:hypothetical protein